MTARTPTTRGKTQTDRVLEALRRGWTCGTWFVDPTDGGAPILRYAARIHELKSRGWWVERRICEHPWHNHDAQMFEWRIHADPAADGQLFGEVRP